MIDVNNKIIFFGYGNVQVGHNMTTIDFTGFKPPTEVGAEITDEMVKDKDFEYNTEPIKFNFETITQVMHFKDLVKSIIYAKDKYFKYNDYIFDFTNYNKKSVKVVLMHIEKIENWFLMPMTC